MTEPVVPMSEDARHLWRMLPAHYRVVDGQQGDDLAQLVAAFGELLAEIRGTLEQRLAEVSPGAQNPPYVFDPDEPPPREAQTWLLPYFASLVGARLVAPGSDGRREEVQRAIGWAKGKGTLRVAEEAAEVVAETEVELREGRALVAVTPRVDLALLPVHAYDGVTLPGTGRQQAGHGVLAAAHPGLPAVTPVVSQRGRAVVVGDLGPGVRRRRLPGLPEGEDEVLWRHHGRRGAPCFPGTYEDVFPRIPDARDPDTGHGHHHPRRLLAHLAPPPGFFAVTYPPPPGAPPPDTPPAPEAVELDTDEVHRIDGGVIADVTVTAGHLVMTGVTVQGSVRLAAGVHRLVDVRLPNPAATVEVASPGRLELLRSAVPAVITGDEGTTADLAGVAPMHERPGPIEATDVVVAVDSLLASVDAGGRVTFDSCTVLGDLGAGALRASDSVFAGNVTLDDPEASCVRYSRVPPSVPAAVEHSHHVTTRPVLFSAFFGCRPQGEPPPAPPGEPAPYGSAGCGVLHPLTADAVRFGAEDGGEMGAYRHRRHTLAERAVVEKLRSLVPLGVEPVAVPDPRLLVRPPVMPSEGGSP